MAELTQQRLKELLTYDPETGIFTWNVCRPVKIKPGDVAGSLDPGGYIRIRADDKSYMAHRLAYFYMKGVWPIGALDHKDRIRRNNAWSNIREATYEENSRNIGMRKDNASGYRGVHWSKRHSKWHAHIGLSGKKRCLGFYEDVELAGFVASEARDKYYREFSGSN